MSVNLILLDLPVPIKTERLLLRPSEPGDGKILNEAVLETFEDLKKWIPWATHKPSLDESEEVARRSGAKWTLREDLMLLIFNKNDGSFVGGTGLHRIDWNIPRFEIGYWVRKSCAGKGYITESTAALSSYAFKQLKARRLEIRCDSENKKSIAVPLKLGFKLEALLKNNMVTPGTRDLRDMQIYTRFDDQGIPVDGVSW